MSTPSTTAVPLSLAEPRRRAAVAAIGFAAALSYVALHFAYAAVYGSDALARVVASSGALLGIAIGTLLAGRLPKMQPVRTLAYLEGAFAILAVALPWILVGLARIDRALLGGIAETPSANWLQTLVQCVVGMLVYAPPGALVALTLLLAMEAVPKRADGYDAATAAGTVALAALGACAGMFVAAFAIVPVAGAAAAAWVAAAVTAATAGLLLMDAQRAAESLADSAAQSPAHHPQPIPTTVTASGKLQVSRPSRTRAGATGDKPRTLGTIGQWCLRAAGPVAGAAAVAGNVVWTRVIAHAAPSGDRFALAMLGAALAGIGVGAFVGRRLVATRLSLGASLAAINIIAAAATVLVYMQVLTWIAPLVQASWLAAAWPAIIALPLAILGASFVVLAEIGTAHAQRVSQAAASALRSVTFGALVGGAAASLWLLPDVGFGAAITCIAAAHAGIAILATPLLDGRARAIATIAAALVAVSAIGLSIGSPTVAAVDPAADVIAVARPIERFYAAGHTHAVRVIEYQGNLIVQVDGALADRVPVRGSAPTQNARKWLATLPITARPDARSVLAIGFNGGVMLEGIPRAIAHVDVIEPEPAIVAANRTIAADRAENPLEQSRVTLIANDPRRALRLSDERYDIVVAQRGGGRRSSAPVALSRELLAEIRDHLTETGIVAQLIDGAAADSHNARTIAATLRAEFAHVRLYQPEPGSLIFLASAMPIEPERQLARSGAPITSEVMHYSRIGMNGVEDLLAALVADDAGIDALAQDDPIRTGDARTVQEAADPLRLRDSWVYTDLADAANFAYLARRLIAQRQRDRAAAIADAHPDESTRLTIVGLLHASQGELAQAAAAYETAIDRRPDNAEARFLLIQPNIALLGQDEPPPALAALAAELPGSATALIAARRAGAAQEWAAMAELDGALSSVSVTDAWYPDVVLARAEWRSRASQNIEQFAFDALRLIDRVVLIEPERNYFLLRTAIGLAIGDGNLAVESSRNIVRLIAERLQSVTDGNGQIERRQVEIIRQNLEAVNTNLRGEIVAANERRAEEVRQSANLILRFLNVAVDTGEQ